MLLRILAAASVLLLLVAGGGRTEEPEAADGAFAKTIQGVRVSFRDPLGHPTEVVGVLEVEDAKTLHVRSAEGLHEIRRSRVLETTPLTLDPRTIYSSEALLERFASGLRAAHPDDPVLSSRDHWHVALYAEWLEAWEAAREHYARCAADATSPRHVAAAAQVVRIEARLREAAALAALKQAEHDVRMNRFRKARRALETCRVEHPDASDALRAKHGLLLEALVLRRTEVLRTRVQGAFRAAVHVLIREKVGEPDIALTDVTAWTRRELPDSALAKVAATLHALDDVTPEEVARLWENRHRHSGRRVATYGSGSFVVEPAAGARPPPRDAWWAAATVREREHWALAYFVERSGLFEVQRREHAPCPACRGTGLLTKRLRGGGTITYVCTHCHGLKHDVVLHYR